MTQSLFNYQTVQYLIIDDEYQNQRIDNFLFSRLKKIPKAMLYKLIRKGEIRVNKKRVKPEYKLQKNDMLRVAPIRLDNMPIINKPDIEKTTHQYQWIENAIIYEDKYLIVVNKPANIAVHGGSGISLGIIEILRIVRQKEKFLELVHRIDKSTSGLLLIAKKRAVLIHIQAQFKHKSIKKSYLTLVEGQWDKKIKKVNQPLLKYASQLNEKKVKVHSEGKTASTYFTVVDVYDGASLLIAQPITGRTHQIRVHALHENHAILGDNKYGSKEQLLFCKKIGLQRLFLHAEKLTLQHPISEKNMTFEASLPSELKKTLIKLKKISSTDQ